MKVEQVDPRDDAAFAGWFAVVEAAEVAARPGEPGTLLLEVRGAVLQGLEPGADTQHVVLAVRADDGTVVGAAHVELPQRDNVHVAEVEVSVHPEARRRGVGGLLITEVERAAREAGRTTVVGYSDEPPGSEGRSDGRAVALARGYEVVQEEVRRDIDLPLDTDRAASLERDCQPHAGDYALRTWVDRCPDDLVDGRAELSRVMSTDVPLDRFDWREEAWDAARVRRAEDLAGRTARTVVNAGAVHVPTGELVAYTQMAFPRSVPARAYQWDTVVRSDHRGRRLGTLVKLETLRLLADLSPSTAFVSTWNAQENAPMIRVNDALGARTNGGLAILQRVLPTTGSPS